MVYKFDNKKYYLLFAYILILTTTIFFINGFSLSPLSPLSFLDGAENSTFLSQPLHFITKDKYKLPILCYHNISEKVVGDESLCISPKEFEKHMEFLKEHDFTPIHFADLENLSSIHRPVLITFDDGYENNFSDAYPILKKYNFKASIFLISDTVDKAGYLSEGQIKNMLDLVDFQSHTKTHPLLSKISPEAMENEFKVSNERIEALSGKKVLALAYPTGDYNLLVESMASKYYQYATTTVTGVNWSGESPYAMKRIYITKGLSFYKVERRLLLW